MAKAFFCEFCEIFKNTFFTEHLRVNAFDIRVRVDVVYNFHLSLQFVTIKCKVFTLGMLQFCLNYCVDLLFDRVIFSHALQDHF